MTTQTVLGWLSAALVVTGIILGLMPVGADCGSAFSAGEGEGCDVLAAQARALPVASIIIGLFAAGAALIGWTAKPKADA